eukprot:645582-Ditylum_brightwellii.AAC.1
MPMRTQNRKRWMWSSPRRQGGNELGANATKTPSKEEKQTERLNLTQRRNYQRRRPHQQQS